MTPLAVPRFAALFSERQARFTAGRAGVLPAIAASNLLAFVEHATAAPDRSARPALVGTCSS